MINLSQPLVESPDAITIQERSIFAAYHVFSACQHQLGNIRDIDFDLLTQLYQLCIPLNKITGIFFLQIDPKTAYQRILRRGRSAETNLTSDYVTEIGALYDKVFDCSSGGFEIPIEVVVKY